MRIVASYERGEDGLFHCYVAGCEQPGYEHPQHLGLHLFHTHGIQGQRSKRPTGARMGRPPKARSALLSAEDVCTTALEAIAPQGRIPIDMIPAFNEWVRQTEAFFGKLLG